MGKLALPFRTRMHIYGCIQWGRDVPKVEISRTRIVARLKREGWQSIGGAKHEKFVKDDRPLIMVPRHRTISLGVARNIALAAGWE